MASNKRTTSSGREHLDPSLEDKFRAWQDRVKQQFPEYVGKFKFNENPQDPDNSYIATVRGVNKIFGEFDVESETGTVNVIESTTPSSKKTADLSADLMTRYKQESSTGGRRVHSKMQEAADTELDSTINFAVSHYPGSKSKQDAFTKFVQRSLKHSEEDDKILIRQVADLTKRIEKLEADHRKMKK